ncbi:MAG: hypothetical protein M3070_17670, partial [Actinomycetota bacterium]|nr:hypothetical protein [Actinomycetota bacterium]
VIDPSRRGDGDQAQRLARDGARRDDLADDLAAAADVLRGCRDAVVPTVTSDVREYLAARAVGGKAKFRSDGPSGADLEDLDGISDADLDVMDRRISDNLAAVLAAVVAGRTEDEVYEIWREACAADVATAEGRLRGTTVRPQLDFDIERVCDVIRSGSVTVERTETGLGTEVSVELSLDAKYKHQLDVVLDSIVSHTDRPVRAFVLCREHGSDDFARMARLFPSVSFVWLPTDNVDYGPIPGMNGWVTSATMDRTLLPVLLGDVDRIVHFDVDALCLSDLGELFDVDMSGTAIAASSEPQPRFLSGFQTIRRSAGRLRRAGAKALARELVIRSHAEHSFDFEIFNAGVMVMDLAKMRADDFCGRYLPMVQTYGVNGQVVVNLYTGGSRHDVGADWNRLIRLEVVPDTARIVHWAGPYKPWHPFYVSGREIWLDGERSFAERTARAQHGVQTGSQA